MSTASNLTQPAAASVPPAAPAAPVATAPWVVALLGVLSGVVGMTLCVGVGVLLWVRPGVMNPLTAALTMGGFLVGGRPCSSPWSPSAAGDLAGSALLAR
ncbi:hypothetical protein ACIRJR_13885 [Streptomyces sp. NPDC102402]|uniref:hypothetical protein n=1 Tax=Streptomyces sp. NPDC102402 TaxID=3366169 RepID=UPI0037FE8E5F